MTRFVCIHTLKQDFPANRNRDDAGLPKMAVFGGVNRARWSSQAQKAAYRASSIWTAARLSTSVRSKDHDLTLANSLDDLIQAGRVSRDDAERVGALVLARLSGKNLEKAEQKKQRAAKAQAARAAKADAKKKKEGVASATPAGETAPPVEADDDEDVQIVALSPIEIEEAKKIAREVAEQLAAKPDLDLKTVKIDISRVLRKHDGAVDIALFGRMLAGSPEYNYDAAAWVQHAITVHKARQEDDYFSAMDDLNRDRGAAHIGERVFTSGIFYGCMLIDYDLLVRNLDGNESLAKKVVRTAVELAVRVAPGGMAASYGPAPEASYAMVVVGDHQPISLAPAFATPPSDADQLRGAVAALKSHMASYDKVYGTKADFREMNMLAGEGSLGTIQTFAAGG